MLFSKISHEADINNVKYSFETGVFARRADASVFARAGDTSVLATVTVSDKVSPLPYASPAL
jgi:polyribonucleotide nucleotidyltransferase